MLDVGERRMKGRSSSYEFRPSSTLAPSSHQRPTTSLHVHTLSSLTNLSLSPPSSLPLTSNGIHQGGVFTSSVDNLHLVSLLSLSSPRRPKAIVVLSARENARGRSRRSRRTSRGLRLCQSDVLELGRHRKRGRQSELS